MSSSQPVRVAIVNDYEVVVRGVHSMLAPFEDRVEVVELDVDMRVASQVDVTLFDSFARGWSHEDSITEVLENPRAGRVAIFTWNMHPDLVEEALSRGCSGYLDKSSRARDLVDALERIAEGQVVVFPTHAADAAPEGERGDWPGRVEGLSAREAEVVALITQGMTNDDIARLSYLSINTVKTYIRNAYRKMGVTRRSQAVRWGIEHGMTPDLLRDTDPEPTGQPGM